MEAAGAAASFQAPCDMPPQRDTTAKALLLPRPHGGASGACKGGDDSFCLQCPNAGGGTDARRFGVSAAAAPLYAAALRSCAPAVALSVPVTAGCDTPLSFIRGTRFRCSLPFAPRSFWGHT
ncbi:hypothetical protein MRX96_022910 [Rhipicephalus microplus]